MTGFRVQGLAAATALGQLSVAACTSAPPSNAGATAAAPNPPLVTDMRQDMAAFDATFRLPAARMRIDSSLVRTATPWLAFGAHGAEYHHAFHDITTGNNAVKFPPRTITGYAAGPGWDPVTGWGSPDGRILVPLLARYAAA